MKSRAATGIHPPYLTLVVIALFLVEGLGAAKRMSKPVVISADNDFKPVIDEKGNNKILKPAFFSIYVGNRFSLPDTNAVDAAKSFATANILRPNEAIYTNSESTVNGSGTGIVPEPTLRVEWEAPFERLPFLPAWGAFSANLSFEAGYQAARNLASADGNFRYLNAQANDVALKDVTYSGSLTVSEKRFNLTPMLGVGVELTNPALQKMNELRLLFRLAGGVALQSGQRNYNLALSPQYISAGSYSDTYVITSTIKQSYAMAALLAGRVEFGTRMRISRNLHLSLMGSLTVYYGKLTYDNVGSFTELAGADKVTFQKIISGTSDQDYFSLMPAIFLALNMEL